MTRKEVLLYDMLKNYRDQIDIYSYSSGLSLCFKATYTKFRLCYHRCTIDKYVSMTTVLLAEINIL